MGQHNVILNSTLPSFFSTTAPQNKALLSSLKNLLGQHSTTPITNSSILLSNEQSDLLVQFVGHAKHIADYQGQIIILLDAAQQSVLFEGTLAKGVRSGYGRELDVKGNLLYEGFFSQDLYQGWGMTPKYEGQFHMGNKHGWGIWKDTQKDIHYQGCFQKDEFNGQGYLNVKADQINDFLSENQMGKSTAASGKDRCRYVGEWRGGKMHGRGKLITPEHIYVGNFSNGLFEGEGRLTTSDDKLQGKFRKGVFVSS